MKHGCEHVLMLKIIVLASATGLDGEHVVVRVFGTYDEVMEKRLWRECQWGSRIRYKNDPLPL